LSTALAAIVPRSGLFVLLQMNPWPAAQHATRVAILVEYCKHFTNDIALLQGMALFGKNGFTAASL